MKKIIALMMLCLLLCAMSVTAFAQEGTITFYAGKDNYTGNMSTIETENNEFTMPTCGFAAPAGTTDEFIGWELDGMLYYVGEKATAYVPKRVNAVWKSDNYILIEYRPGRGTAENETIKGRVVGHIGHNEVQGTDSFYFKAPANEYFQGWRIIEGDGEKFDEEPNDGGSLGWLFNRAIAEDELLQRDDTVIARSSLVLEAQWGSTPAGGGQGGGGQGGGGNNGGAAAGDMPSTGDNSLPMAFLMLMLAASVGGVVLMAKRRTN